MKYKIVITNNTQKENDKNIVYLDDTFGRKVVKKYLDELEKTINLIKSGILQPAFDDQSIKSI